MQSSGKFVANPGVVLREEFDDWAVLFDPDTGHGFGLNPTGVYLWKLLDGEHTLDALVRKVRDYTGNLPDHARGDIAAFVDELVLQGLAGCYITPSGRLNTERRRQEYSHPPQRTPNGAIRYELPRLE